MSEIKELNCRCEFAEDDGMACGPCGIAVIEAEMEIEDDGKKLFLLVEWIDAVGEISARATTESIYDVLVMKEEYNEHFKEIQNNAVEDYYDIAHAFEKSKYAEQYKKLKEMLLEVAKENDIDLEDDEDFEDEETEEEK